LTINLIILTRSNNLNKMKLRSGKYTSKDDIVGMLEEQPQEVSNLDNNEKFTKLDLDDVIFGYLPEIKYEFIIGTLSVLWVIGMYLFIYNNF
jgi:hypothetical protein